MFRQNSHVLQPFIKAHVAAVAILGCSLASSYSRAQEVGWMKEFGVQTRVDHRVLAVKKTPDDGVVTVARGLDAVIVARYSSSFSQIWRVRLDEKLAADGAALEIDNDGNAYIGLLGDALTQKEVVAYKILASSSGRVAWRTETPYSAGIGQVFQFNSQLAQGSFWVLDNAFSQDTGILVNSNIFTEPSAELLSDGTHYVSRGDSGTGRFVVNKRAPNGAVLWTGFVQTGGNVRHGVRLVESGGFLYAAGNVGDSNGSLRIALAKLNAATGAVVWEKYHDDAGSEFVKDLVVDTTGAMVFTGYLNLNGAYQLVTWKYSTAGDLVWQRNIAGGTNSAGNKIALNENNDVFVAGFTTNSNQNGSLTKYSAAGNQLWSRPVGLSGSDELTELFLSQGHPVVGGYIQEGAAARNGIVAQFRTNDGGTIGSKTTDLLRVPGKFPTTVQSWNGDLFTADAAYITKNTSHSFTRWSRSASIGLADHISSHVLDTDVNPVLVDAQPANPGDATLLVVTKLNQAHGGLIWQRSFGQWDQSQSATIMAGLDGDLYVTHLAHNDSEAPQDRGTYIHRINRDGQLVWTQHQVGFNNAIVDVNGALVVHFGTGSPKFLKRLNRTSGSTLWVRPTQATRLFVGGDGLPVVSSDTFTEKVRLNNGGTYWSVPSALTIHVDQAGNAYTAEIVDGMHNIRKIRGNDGANLWLQFVPNMEVLLYAHSAGRFLALAGYNSDELYPKTDGDIRTHVALLDLRNGQFQWGIDLDLEGTDRPTGVLAGVTDAFGAAYITGLATFENLGQTGFLVNVH